MFTTPTSRVKTETDLDTISEVLIIVLGTQLFVQYMVVITCVRTEIRTPRVGVYFSKAKRNTHNKGPKLFSNDEASPVIN